MKTTPIFAAVVHGFTRKGWLLWLGMFALRAHVQAAMDVHTIGLKGDGSADDTTALQTALDHGKTDLYFSKGEYFLGGILLPAGTHLAFDPAARIKINVQKIIYTEPDPKNPGKINVKKKPLFEVRGDLVKIEGLWFDFASGGTDPDPSPLEVLVFAKNVRGVTVSGVYAQTTYPRQLVPLEMRARMVSPWEYFGPSQKLKRGEGRVILRAEDCRNIVLENSGATFVSHMISTSACSNVISRGNWMISGLTITTFANGSESLRHYDNWSRDVNYQVVWRGGSPDPSRKAPKVPLGSATVVKREIKPDNPAWEPNTAGAFDVMVKNNYAEYGNTLAWGNKGRQVIIDGNIARFISDYAYGTEGGENIVFSNNISINSTAGGIVSMYWGEKLLVTGNMILVRHEPWDPNLSRFPKPSSYLGCFVCLHHGPSNPEDRYGAGSVLISNNQFSNELTNVTKTVTIQPSRDVTIIGNKFINGTIEKLGEEQPGEGVLNVMNNEFICRTAGDPICIRSGFRSSVSIIRDNVFRKENPAVETSDAEKNSEKDEVPYLLFTEKADGDKKTNSNPEKPKSGQDSAAIVVSANQPHFAVIQSNLIHGWKDAIFLSSPKKNKATFVASDNIVDGTITIDAPDEGTTKRLENNIFSGPAMPAVGFKNFSQ